MRVNGIPLNRYVINVILLSILSCDSFKEDSIRPGNQVTFSQKEFYVLTGSSFIIDLKSLVKAPFTNVSLSVSQKPWRGELLPLDTHLLKYQPAPDFTEGRDQIVFSALHEGKVLKTETIIIFTKQHLDEFPCAIYPVEDMVIVKEGESISIAVLENDRLCGTNNSSPQISIHTGPRYGEGRVEGNSVVVYTPGRSFRGHDELVYELTAAPGGTSTYGVITITDGRMLPFVPMPISADENHSMALKQDGTLWWWGGDYFMRTTPIQIGTGFAAVAGGLSALKQDSTLWAVKYDEFRIPRLVKMGSGFSAIASGTDHSLALKTDGTLWAWGSNEYGQLGNGSNVNKVNDLGALSSFAKVGSGYVAIAAGYGQSFALKEDSTLWAWGGNDGVHQTTPMQIGSGYVRIAAGGDHLLVQQADGMLWDFKYGYGHRVDSPFKWRIGMDFTAFAAGGLHSLALKADGTLWAWGDNKYGQLGDGTNVEKTTPVQIGSGYARIAAGYAHSLALKTDGTIWAWGYNGEGELGDGTTVHKYSPVLIVF